MYLGIHNESNNCLSYRIGDTLLGLLGGGKTLVKVERWQDIVIYYEVGTYKEYTRYFKEIDIKDVRGSDLYFNFVNNKIIVREE